MPTTLTFCDALTRWLALLMVAGAFALNPLSTSAQVAGGSAVPTPSVPQPALPDAPRVQPVALPRVAGALPVPETRPSAPILPGSPAPLFTQSVAQSATPSAAPSAGSSGAAPVASAPTSQSPGAKRLLRLEGTLAIDDGGAQAVAINADESLLAVAQEDGSTTRIVIFDRPSKTRIGRIDAKVGSAPRIMFAPNQDLLLIAGSKGVQLWDVPIAPLKPDQALDEKYRLWEQSVSGSGGTPQIAFADPPTHVVWSRGGALYRREASGTSAAADKPTWQADGDGKLSGFAFARGGAGLAIVYAGQKGVDLLDSRTLTLLGSLTGHRFPVVGVAYQGKGWLTLDTGWHALRWSENLQAQDSTFLENLPRSGEPVGLTSIGPKHFLISVPGDGGQQRIVTSAPGWRAEDKLAATPDGLAISPTGRYLLTLEGAKGEQVKLYGFAAPESPLDYVRRLQAAKAYRSAQGYVRLLDETGLSPKLKSSLLAELSQVPASVKVQDFQERLARARRDGNLEGVRHWAEQILNLRPQDPDATAALQDMKTQGERRILNQAKEALKQGQTAQVISILTTQIPSDSTLQGEAAAVIKQAEAQRRIAGLLTQAREQLNLGNYPAATALAQEALRENSDDPAARSLLSDIQDRSGTKPYPRWIPIGVGMVLALAIVGFAAHRFRGRLMPLFRKAEPAGTSSWGGMGAGLGGDQDDPFGPASVGSSRPSPRPSPKPSPGSPLGPGPRPAPRSPSTGATASRESARESARPARPSAASAASSRSGAAQSTSARPAPQSPRAAVERPAPERVKPAQPSPARRQVVEELLQRTEDLMRLAQQADVAREHTSMLMELEAELAAFHRRVGDSGVDLGPVHQRLKSIHAQVRELKFTRREPPPQPPPAAKPQAAGEPTWYEVLQVPESAGEIEIRASYHQLLKQYHPDLHNHSGFPWVKEQAEQMTKKLGAAFQILSRAESRQEYDRELRRRRS